MNRQLTAIMFADMVGYTALMQEDEAQAKTNRDRNRESLVRQVGEHNGKILQFYGDGALSVFRSAIQGLKPRSPFREISGPLRPSQSALASTPATSFMMRRVSSGME